MEDGVYYLLRNGIGIPRYMYQWGVYYNMVGFGFLFTVQQYFEFEIGTTIQRGVLSVFVFIELLAQITCTLAACLWFKAVLT